MSERGANAPQYWVMRQTTSKKCRVQAADESPLGARFRGPFATRAEAVAEMCRLYDRTMTDEDMCWQVAPADACGEP